MEYTLRDITDRLCEKDGEILDEQLKQTRYECYHKKFMEIFQDVLDLREEIESLKGDNGYRFRTNKDISFIMYILYNFTEEPMVSLRRSDLEKVGDGFIVFICDGVLSLFDKPEMHEKKIFESVKGKLDNRFNYNFRKRKVLIKSLQKSLPKVLDKYNRVNDVDKDVWLHQFEFYYKKFLSEREKILEYMDEIRGEELSDCQDREKERLREGKRVTEEDIDMEVNRRCNEDNQYRDLRLKYDDICKINNDFVISYKRLSKVSRLRGKKIKVKPIKKPFFSYVLKQLRDSKVLESMNQIEEKIRTDVINDFNGYELEGDDAPFVSPEELYRKALKRYVKKYKSE